VARESVNTWFASTASSRLDDPKSGAIVLIEWLRYDDEPLPPHEFAYIVQSGCTAVKTDEKNDYTVCAKFGLRGSEINLLDVYRDRTEISLPACEESCPDRSHLPLNAHSLTDHDQGRRILGKGAGRDVEQVKTGG
jgi:hypothetical protein